MGLEKQWVCKCDFDNVYNINWPLLNSTKENQENNLYEDYKTAQKWCEDENPETWDLITLKALKQKMLRYGASFRGKLYFCNYHTGFINRVNNFDKNILIDTTKEKPKKLAASTTK